MIGVQHYNWFLEGDIDAPEFPFHDGMVFSEKPDHLWLNTGTAFGEVPVVINVLDGPPQPTADWEKVEETTLVVTQRLKIIGGDNEWYGNIDVA